MKAWMLALTLGALGPGCMPQTIVTAASDTAKPTRPPMRRMLVMTERLGPNDRSAVEEQLVATLRREGVDAHAGTELFVTPPADREMLRNTLVTNGYEGAIILALVDVVDEQCGVIYTCMHDRGGFMTDDRYVTVESMLWDVRGGDDIVWRASTETMNPNDRKDLARNLSSTIVPELTRTRFVAHR